MTGYILRRLLWAIPVLYFVATITFLLIRDAPVIGIAWWVTAAIMWIWHVMIRRRLRVSGL